MDPRKVKFGISSILCGQSFTHSPHCVGIASVLFKKGMSWVCKSPRKGDDQQDDHEEVCLGAGLLKLVLLQKKTFKGGLLFF